MPFDTEKKPLICDGCRETSHNCSGNNAIAFGSETGRPCECLKCSKTTTTGNISQDLKNKFNRSFSGI